MHSYKVELRILGEQLDFDEISRSLSLNPTQLRQRGERKSEGSTWKMSMWSFDVLPLQGNSWNLLEDGLRALLDKLSSSRNAIRVLNDSNEVLIWCGHFTSSFDGGPRLSPELLHSLGVLGVTLVIDTYCETSIGEVNEHP